MVRPYFGWYVVAICACALALSIGGSIQAFGLFVLPVSKAFGLSRAQVNTGAILLNIGMALAGPADGKLIDSGSIRIVMRVSALLLCGSLVVLGSSHSILLSAGMITIPLAAAIVGSGTVASPTLIARWFDHNRGRAMAIGLAGIALGPIVVAPSIGLLIEAGGWRMSLIVASVVLGVLLLALAILVRERPGPNDVEGGKGNGLEVLDQGALAKPLAMSRMLRMGQFWTIALGVACAYGIMQTLIVSLVPFGQGKVISTIQAAGLISIYGAASLAGSLAFSWLRDRLNRLMMLVTLGALLGVATGSLRLAEAFPAMLASVVFVGIVSGAITPAFLALLGDCFGPVPPETATGLASFISAIVSGAAIRFGSKIYDCTGGYYIMLAAFLVAGILAAGLVALISRFRTPGRAP